MQLTVINKLKSLVLNCKMLLKTAIRRHQIHRPVRNSVKRGGKIAL